MPIRYVLLLLTLASAFLFSCTATKKVSRPATRVSSLPADAQAPVRSTVILRKEIKAVAINTKKVTPQELTDFAKLQLGVPYLYGSTDKKKGFDCSGFISYVFGHFDIAVPRVTYQFTNAGIDIPIEFSKPGDIILFTGSNASSGEVGHMGIITENIKGVIKFIHASTSSGVVISAMNSYFIPRFVKVNRVFIPSLPVTVLKSKSNDDGK